MELEVVRRNADEKVEELARLQDGRVGVGFRRRAVIRGDDGGYRGMKFGVNDGPEHGQVDCASLQDKGPDDHVNLRPRSG